MTENWKISIQDYDRPERIDHFLNEIRWEVYEGSNLLITGCNGMLGLCLVTLLARAQKKGLFQANRVYLASRSGKSEHLDLEDNFECIKNEDLVNICDEVNVVIHAASPSNATKINSLGDTLNVNSLKNFRFHNITNFVYISSGEVYLGGPTNREPTEHDFNLAEFRHIYPYSKFYSENKFIGAAKEHEFNLSIVRLFHTFGPGLRRDDGRSFSDFIWAAAAGKTIYLHSSGDQVRTFLYVIDACLGIFKAATYDKNTKIFNIGSSNPISIIDFAGKVAHLSGSQIQINNSVGKVAPSPFHSIIPDLSEQIHLKWIENYSLDFAIQKTLNWAESTLKS
jgi:UDP-glucuronate decarboxylase